MRTIFAFGLLLLQSAIVSSSFDSPKHNFQKLCTGCGCSGEENVDYKTLHTDTNAEDCYLLALNDDFCGNQFVVGDRVCYCRSKTTTLCDQASIPSYKDWDVYETVQMCWRVISDKNAQRCSVPGNPHDINWAGLGKQEDVEACADACSKDENCRYAHFNTGNNKCTPMKTCETFQSSGDNFFTVVDTESMDFGVCHDVVSENKAQRCHFPGDVHRINWSGLKKKKTATACADACFKDPKCRYAHFKMDNKKCTPFETCEYFVDSGTNFFTIIDTEKCILKRLPANPELATEEPANPEPTTEITAANPELAAEEPANPEPTTPESTTEHIFGCDPCIWDILHNDFCHCFFHKDECTEADMPPSCQWHEISCLEMALEECKWVSTRPPADYMTITDGLCSSISDAQCNQISSLTECSNAAAQLTSLGVISNSTVGAIYSSSAQPPGCFLFLNDVVNWRWITRFNWDMSSTMQAANFASVCSCTPATAEPGTGEPAAPELTEKPWAPEQGTEEPSEVALGVQIQRLRERNQKLLRILEALE